MRDELEDAQVGREDRLPESPLLLAQHLSILLAQDYGTKKSRSTSLFSGGLRHCVEHLLPPGKGVPGRPGADSHNREQGRSSSFRKPTDFVFLPYFSSVAKLTSWTKALWTRFSIICDMVMSRWASCSQFYTGRSRNDTTKTESGRLLGEESLPLIWTEPGRTCRMVRGGRKKRSRRRWTNFSQKESRPIHRRAAVMPESLPSAGSIISLLLRGCSIRFLRRIWWAVRGSFFSSPRVRGRREWSLAGPLPSSNSRCEPTDWRCPARCTLPTTPRTLIELIFKLISI